MESDRVRRRRLTLSVLTALAVAGFAIGAVVGSFGSGGRPSARQAGQGSTAGGGSGGSTTTGADEEARPTLAETLRPGELAGERIVVSIDGTELTSALRRAIAEGRVAGVVLFEADFPTRAAGRALIEEVQAVPRPRRLAHLPLLVMTDQEGGEVKRVDGPPRASAAAMGRAGAAYAREQGRLTAANLQRLGVSVDLAPVLDVGRPGGVIAATGRAFADTAPGVVDTAVPFAEGLEAGGVAATAKHFPGLGAATENTDFEAQRLNLTKGELRAVDTAPYGAFIAAGGRLVMLATAIYPALSPRPAAFSRRIATGELRGRLGFRGVTITDSLGSTAVAEFAGQREVAVDGAAAGDDLLLFDDLPSALAGHEALVAQLHQGGLKRPPFLAAAGRVLRLRRELGRG
ncbi:MAG TPA: glycoside hydrolase family 3 N-terminal domain-containing protein [Solirubrobacterales bacterium]|nr:glycoside hydrolase family 3 N-terminal domain-containing protein [Solirubrobacterales bacterium]